MRLVVFGVVFLENKNDCSSREYFEENGEKVYLVCYDNAKIKNNESILELSDYLKNNGINVFLNKISEVTDVSVYKDGGSAIYKGANIVVIKCNALNDNGRYIKGIYVGDLTLEYKDVCK